MKLIKQFLIFTVELFFKIYFLIVGTPKVTKDLQTAIDLYRGKGFSSLFKLIRVWDAPYTEIENLIPKKGKIIDLGSGDGLMANYLGVASKKRSILGIELNKSRLVESDRGVTNVKFKVGDILKSKINKVDSILLIHVLHHLPSYKSQIKIIEACKRNLNKGGRLIVAEIINKPFVKYLFTFLVDTLVLPIVFNNKLFDSHIFYRNDKDWKSLFKEQGFRIKATYPHKGKPFSHVVYECQLS